MQRRFFDQSLASIAALAHSLCARMDGTAADEKTTREALAGYVSDLKGLIGTAKDGATAVASFNESLIKDNYNLRESKRQLKGELEAAKKLPDGSKIIAKDDALAFDKFKALGIKAEDIPAILESNKTLKVGQTARDAAEALNWKYKPLQQLLSDKNLNIEMRETEVEEENGGKKEKVKKQLPFVIEGEKKDKATRLDEYEPLKDFHTSLVMDEEGAGAAGRSTHGVKMPAQTGSTGSNGSRKKGGEMSSIVSNTLDTRYKRPEAAAAKK